MATSTNRTMRSVGFAQSASKATNLGLPLGPRSEEKPDESQAQRVMTARMIRNTRSGMKARNPVASVFSGWTRMFVRTAAQGSRPGKRTRT
jgi:hypothetical protein